MWKYILKATAIAGTLDITGACIQAYMVRGTTPTTVLQYIASGVFDKAAFSGGAGYILFGLLVHFFIAFSCAACYFFLYSSLFFYIEM